MVFSFSAVISLFGLALDILGAWYISRGLIKKDKGELLKETGFCFGTNDNYVISGLHQKVECKNGFVLLLFGFSIQGAASFVNLSIDFIWKAIAVVTLLVVLLIVILIVEKVTIKNKYKSTKIYIKSKVDSLNKAPHVEDSKRMLKYIGVRFSKDIVKDYAWELLKKSIN